MAFFAPKLKHFFLSPAKSTQHASENRRSQGFNAQEETEIRKRAKERDILDNGTPCSRRFLGDINRLASVNCFADKYSPSTSIDLPYSVKNLGYILLFLFSFDSSAPDDDEDDE